MSVAILDSTTTSAQSNEDIQQQIPVSSDRLRILTDANTVLVASSASSNSESRSIQTAIFIESIDCLIETLDIVNDRELIESIQRGVRESAEGKGQDLEDVFTELGWE